MPHLKKLDAHLLVCVHKTCRKQGSRLAARELKRTLKAHGLRRSVLVTKVDCLDQCGRGPVVVVYPDGVWYGKVDEASARQIVEQHIKEGRIDERNVLHDMRGKEAGTR
ncbi:MAG: (2Fe-2S) ferredoxin domain-containing protein [Pyrinomonadaceae bacterium]